MWAGVVCFLIASRHCDVSCCLTETSYHIRCFSLKWPRMALDLFTIECLFYIYQPCCLSAALLTVSLLLDILYNVKGPKPPTVH